MTAPRPPRAPAVALVGALVAMAIVHAIVAALAPISADDWSHWNWAGTHPDAGVATWLATHARFADAMAYLLARCDAVHVIVTPAVSVALVIGVFVLAARRLPRASWDDALAVMLGSALVWITLPRAGIVWFHRSYLGADVYGCAAAVWFVAPLRCGWRAPAWLWAPLGYLVGTSTRAIALAALVGVVLAIRARPRAQRARWLYAALAGLVVGTAVGYALPPYLELGRVFRRGLEPNLVLLNYAVREAGELVSLVLAFLLGERVLRALGRAGADGAPGDGQPDPIDTARWCAAWLALSVWALFGPKSSEATMLPATLALIVAALPWLGWLARVRVLRALVIALVVIVHAIAWSYALATYREVGRQYRDRLAAIERAAPGTTATIPTYTQILPDFWFFGEDFAGAGPRQIVAIEAFGLADLELAPAFRKLEPNPHVELALETDDASPAELAAARAPTVWGSELAVARHQLEQLARRFHRVTGRALSARLVVRGVAFAELHDRPLYAAWLDRGQLVPGRVTRAPGDANDRFQITVTPATDPQFTECWLVVDGVARPLAWNDGHPRLQPMVKGRYVVVACDRRRCLAVDALVARF